jgi:predicted nucleic acid-binding protein
MNDDAEFHFVDTNVFVYAYDQSAGIKQEKAGALLQRLWRSGKGCLSLQVLQEFYVIVTRKIQSPLPVNEATQIIKDLRGWQIHRPTVEDVLGAITIQTRFGISFWDALILRSASQLECATIWSEDLNPGQVYESVQVRNPFAS